MKHLLFCEIEWQRVIERKRERERERERTIESVTEKKKRDWWRTKENIMKQRWIMRWTDGLKVALKVHEFPSCIFDVFEQEGLSDQQGPLYNHRHRRHGASLLIVHVAKWNWSERDKNLRKEKKIKGQVRSRSKICSSSVYLYRILFCSLFAFDGKWYC